MMVFFKEKLAMLSVPKTGTTAYAMALRSRADLFVAHPTALKHMNIQRFGRFIHPMYAKACGVDLEVMAVMREPVDWLGSWWRYRQRPDLDGHPNSTRDVSFDDFVLGYLKGQRPAYASVGSQARFLTAKPGAVQVSHLFRYADQAGIQAFLEARLGLRPDTNRHNVSPRMPVTLSPEIEARLREKCADEFALYDAIPAHWDETVADQG